MKFANCQQCQKVVAKVHTIAQFPFHLLVFCEPCLEIYWGKVARGEIKLAEIERLG